MEFNRKKKFHSLQNDETVTHGIFLHLPHGQVHHGASHFQHANFAPRFQGVSETLRPDRFQAPGVGRGREGGRSGVRAGARGIQREV